MNIVVSGSTGLVGRALVSHLSAKGHRIIRLVRATPKPGGDEILWDPIAGRVEETGLEGADAVVHLAGENVAARRWTKKQKNKIRNSRVYGTRTLCDALARLKKRPSALLSASAIGYYGDRADEILSEENRAGSGFLPAVCAEWETATAAAAQKGIRVVNLRIGVILSAEGGALARMLLPYRLGLGGPLGGGRQYMSWISIDDTVRAIAHALETPGLAGPVNLVSPAPVTNREFNDTLGKVLRRPAILPMPAFAARLAFGEMADALLLASARVVPGRLMASGFQHLHPTLEGALRHVLK